MVAGIALASLFINMFCQSIFVGFNYLIATLASQAYGAEDYKLVGQIFNKGRVSVAIFFIPMAVILIFSRQILNAFGIDSEASYYASIYIYANIPGVFFLSQFDAMRNYLNAMHQSQIILKATIFAAIIHVPICYLLVYVLGL